MTVDEWKAFCMLMTINHLPETEDYWKLFNYSPISSRISHDRFRELSRYLQFVNSMLPACGDPAYDRLGKIRRSYPTPVSTVSGCLLAT